MKAFTGRFGPFFFQVVPDDFGKTRQLPERGGFFSSILKTVGGIAGSLLGIAPAAAPAVAPVTAVARVAAAARTVAPVVGGALIGAALIPGAVGTAVLAPGVSATGVRKQTIVETLNAQNQVVARKFLPGAPFLMNKDLVTAKRVFRTIRKAEARMPKRIVHPSAVSQLKDAAVDKALRHIVSDGHHGHCPEG